MGVGSCPQQTDRYLRLTARIVGINLTLWISTPGSQTSAAAAASTITWTASASVAHFVVITLVADGDDVIYSKYIKYLTYVMRRRTIA